MREVLATHLWPEGERNPGNVGVLLPNWNVRYHNDSILRPLSIGTPSLREPPSNQFCK